MFTNFVAIRLLRAVAAAIRNRDTASIINVIQIIADVAGLNVELAQLQAVIAALTAKDWDKAVSALSNFLELLVRHFNLPSPQPKFGAIPDQPHGADVLAARLEDEARHLEIHCGIPAGTVLPDDGNEAAGKMPMTAVGVNPLVIIGIVEAIIKAISFWRNLREDAGK